ncbi:hypothetical protein FA13DRAFT_1810483 [Coprinellus micaceus]|uniref:Uncharacterized protein n=1 Tax=Coprinellus micaceus TaxID=71717 RepID=A0A4Y7TSP3_COPMI|nr:hypothetical protein FA13DRAFT_1810483 [Coprinellus micaceus]
MSLTPEKVASIGEAISSWRLQECIILPFYTLYIHYWLTTVDEEVNTILPQKRWVGKLIFALMRYGTLLFILMGLHANYRTYLEISPEACKGILIASSVTVNLVALVADVTVGICFSVLLGVRKWYYFSGIMLLCSGLPTVYLIFQLLGYIHAPADPLSSLDEELGYPCYVPDDEAFSEGLPGGSMNLFSYLNFARSILLLLLAFVTFWIRLKERGKLTKVIGRDGGIYYISAAVIRLLGGIMFTPALIPQDSIRSSPIFPIFQGLNQIVIPILAQRLLLNIRALENSHPRTLTSSHATYLDRPGRVHTEDLFWHSYDASDYSTGTVRRTTSWYS